VGRAIVRQPQVFRFDEPLSNLDAKLRVQTRKEIARLHRHLAAVAELPGSRFDVPRSALGGASVRDDGARRVTLGIRPEDIYLSAAAPADARIGIEAVVDAVEPMGNEIFVYARVHQLRQRARHLPSVRRRVRRIRRLPGVLASVTLSA
jgi:ABC-type sugar transport system ATPase subunit